MKPPLQWLVLIFCLSFAPVLHADGLVMRYWPMHHGDIKHYSDPTGKAGSSYIEISQDFWNLSHYLLHLYMQDPSDGQFNEEAVEEDGYSGDALLSYGGEVGWTHLSYVPPLTLLDEHLLANGGTRTSSSTVHVSGQTIPISVTVAVKSVGTVTVRAGTYHDCRQLDLTIRTTNPSAVLQIQAQVLAPYVGVIKIAAYEISGAPGKAPRLIGWQELTGGVVDGEDVRNLANRIPPTITQQPRRVTVNEGANAMFSVTASGMASLTYQWSKDGVNLSGQTSSSLSLNGVTTAQAGNYTVVVSNPLGSVTSQAATLTVKSSGGGGGGPTPAAPIITKQPTGKTVKAGKKFTLSVKAKGMAPISYQWYRNDAAIPGAIQSSLAFARVQPANAGTYRVTVSNSVGSVTSAVAVLSVP